VNPKSPFTVSTTALQLFYNYNLAISSDYSTIYAATYSGVVVLNITNPSNVTQKTVLLSGNNVYGVTILKNTLYVSLSYLLLVFDITGGNALNTRNYSLQGLASRVAVSSDGTQGYYARLLEQELIEHFYFANTSSIIASFYTYFGPPFFTSISNWMLSVAGVSGITFTKIGTNSFLDDSLQTIGIAGAISVSCNPQFTMYIATNYGLEIHGCMLDSGKVCPFRKEFSITICP